MIKIDIISGFLGAGKTTLIQKLLKEAIGHERVVLIENEFGEIGIDSGFLKESGVEMKEMNSGCICCSLVGDFGTSLQEVMETYAPDRILIEPSGVGKLSDVIKAVRNVADTKTAVLNSASVVVDASRCRMYLKNFGEFFGDQLTHAETIFLSRTDRIHDEAVAQCVGLLRAYNAEAVIVTTSWTHLDGQAIMDTMEKTRTLESDIQDMIEGLRHTHEHDHHGHENCGCGHGHHGHENCGCGHDHHEHESCGCKHDHHHAEEIFSSFGLETPMIYGRAELSEIMEKLASESEYGVVLRAKGMVDAGDGKWLYFDYVPGESNIRDGKADVTGKICVIGTGLRKDMLSALWR